MSIKLGTTSVKIPYSRAYLGNKLIYQAAQLIPFTSCPFPTSWTPIIANTKYNARNDYGNWRIIATNSYTSSYAVYKMFDNNYSSYWRPASLGNDDAYEECTIECPTGVSIKPLAISLKYLSEGNYYKRSLLKGLNIMTNEWENLHTLKYNETLSVQEDIEINAINYYSKFKIISYRKNSSNTYPLIYEFRINSGIIKQTV